MHKENRKILSLFSVAVVLLLSISAAFSGVPNEPHNANAIWIEPSTVNLTTANPAHTIGYKFNITEMANMTTLVSSAVGIVTWQLKLYFNTSQLKALRTDYTEKGPPKTSQLFAGIPTIPVVPIIDNVHGYVLHSETCAPSNKPVPCSGSLIWIEFNVTKVPSGGQTLTSLFNINNPDTAIVDEQGNQYPPNSITRYNGQYRFETPVPEHTLTITSTAGGTTNPSPGIYSYAQGTNVSVRADPDPWYILDHWELDEANVGAPNPIQVTMDTDHTLHAVFSPITIEGTILYVDPLEIIDPNMLPSSTFAINITVDHVANLQICEFNLTYDTNVLSWVGIELFKVQGKTPSATSMFDDETGYIWVKLTYPSSITTDSPIALVRIRFHVDAIGTTPLDLTDTTLTDSAGQPITHTAIDGFFASLIQDLAITSVVASPNIVYRGQLVTINVTAKNLGNQPESFDVKAYYDSGLVGTQHVTDLDPNAEAKLTFIWNTSMAEPFKDYTIKADATVLPYEENTDDNTYIDGTVQILIQDLAITSVVPSRSWVYQGWQLNINATAKNLGNNSQTFNVALYYDNSLIETKQVVNLAPSAEITLTFTWNTSAVAPCHNYTITGKIAILPWEFNATNNIYIDGNVKVRFMGDVDGNGQVDIFDVRLIAECFGSYPGNPRWNPDYDLNQSGGIDIFDIRLAAKNFGKQCSP